jgi:STIP1 homology and U-box containing protein 1
MAGQDIPSDPAKSLEWKEKGNKCFQAGDFVAAEEFYAKAFVPFPLTPLPFTHQEPAPSSTPTVPSPC